jgi:hypothetical protein
MPRVRHDRTGALNRSLKRDDPHEHERRKQHEAKNEEGRSETGELRNERKGDQRARDRADIERCAAIDVFDFLSLGGLEGGLFRRQNRNELLSEFHGRRVLLRSLHALLPTPNRRQGALA